MLPTTDPSPATRRAGIAGPAGALVRVWVCPVCRYDLAGLPASGVCPECGTPRDPGTLHVGGWSHAARVPFGPRARLRAAIFSVVLSIPFGGMLRHWVGALGVALPIALTHLGAAGAIFALIWFFGGRSGTSGRRPLELELGRTGVQFSGRVWSKRRIPWSRYRIVRVRRLSGRLWELRLLAPFWQRHLMETLPWHTGFWYVRLVFEGSRRDAALVRRIATQRTADARAD